MILNVASGRAVVFSTRGKIGPGMWARWASMHVMVSDTTIKTNGNVIHFSSDPDARIMIDGCPNCTNDNATIKAPRSQRFGTRRSNSRAAVQLFSLKYGYRHHQSVFLLSIEFEGSHSRDLKKKRLLHYAPVPPLTP